MRVRVLSGVVGLFVLGGPSCAPVQDEGLNRNGQKAAERPQAGPSARPSFRIFPSPSPLPSPAAALPGPPLQEQIADRLDGIDREYAPRAAQLSEDIDRKREELATIEASSKQQASQLAAAQRNREFQAQQNNELLRQLSARSALEAQAHDRAAFELQQTILNTAAPWDSDLMIGLRTRLAQEQQAAAQLRSQSGAQLYAQSTNTQEAVDQGSAHMEESEQGEIDLEIGRNRLTAELNDLQKQLEQLNRQWAQEKQRVSRLG